MGGPGALSSSSSSPTPSGRERRATPRRRDTHDPRGSRRRALKLLFEADVRGEPPAAALERAHDDDAARSLLDAQEHEPWTEDGATASPRADAGAGAALRPATSPPPLDGFTRALVEGVAEHAERIDQLIDRFARRWRVERMPVVDRNVLRLAVLELLDQPTPPAVVVAEAVALAKELSTDDAGRFVNGVLEAVRRHLASGADRSGTEDDDTGDAGATGPVGDGGP